MTRPHGYILRTGARLAPFGDAVGESPILNRRLEDVQRAALAAVCGEVQVIDRLDEVRAPEFLLVEDHLYFSRWFLARALRAARGGDGPVRFALDDSLFLREKSPLGALDLRSDASGTSAPLPFVLWRGARPPSPEALADLPLARVKIDEKPFVPDTVALLSDGEGAPPADWSLTREGVLSIRHWSHLLDASQAALADFWMDFSPRRVAWLLLRAASALSFNKWRVAARLNFVGSKCDIHPTAWVAGSVLGDGVSVGPHSSVFGSVLGDGVKVEAGSEVALSAVGARSLVSFHTRLNASVVYPNALVSYPAAQMSVLGRRSRHLGGCYPLDMKLSRGELRDVRVQHGGQLVDSGKKFLGMCLGHGAIVGTGLWLQSGIEVPNGYLVVRDKADLVTRLPDGAGDEVLTFRGGAGALDRRRLG